MLLNILLTVAAYLLGSVSTAIVICRVMGLPDPRGLGSGNPGATNVLRTGSKTAAIITLIGDMLKGLVPVLIARALELPDAAVAAVGVAAFIGHLYPLYFGFKGGKGVATYFGVLLGFDWLVGLLTLATWLAMAGLFRISSLSALVATLLAPGYIYWLTGSQPLTIAGVALTVLIYWRHRSNISNLLAGKEERIGRKGKDSP